MQELKKSDFCIQPIQFPQVDGTEIENFVMSFRGDHIATRKDRVDCEKIRDEMIQGSLNG